MQTMNRLRKKSRQQSHFHSLKKYLGIYLMKEPKDLFNENYKSLKREIEEDIRRWKDLPCSGDQQNQLCEM
jgi:hypothetical protein